MQMAIANKVSKISDHRLYQAVGSALPSSKKAAYSKLAQQAERIKRRIHGRPLDIWHNLSLFIRFVEFYDLLTAEQQFDVLEVAGAEILAHQRIVIDPQKLNVLEPSEWHVETGGYLQTINLR